MKLHIIDAGQFKLDGGAMHGVIPKSMWHKQNPADESNMVTWTMRSLLIEDGDRKILIDTGMGDKQSEKFFGYYYPSGKTLMESLNEQGFAAEDITDVFLTHLHFDHCGGAVIRDGEQLKVQFPNATYWSCESHWKTATQPNAREKASFLKENIVPIQESGQLKFVEEKEDIQFSENIKIKFVHGHTEAMMLPVINYNGQIILYCADLIPAKSHISMPWVMAYDMQPLETLNEKERILPEAYENNWWLFFEHGVKNACCKLIKDDRGRIRGGENVNL